MNYSGKEHRDYLLAEQFVAILFTIEKILFHLFQLRHSLSEVRKAFSGVLFRAQNPKQNKDTCYRSLFESAMLEDSILWFISQFLSKHWSI